MKSQKKCPLNCKLCDDPHYAEFHAKEDAVLMQIATAAVNVLDLLKQFEQQANFRSLPSDFKARTNELRDALTDFYLLSERSPEVAKVVDSLRVIESSLASEDQ